MKLNNFSVFFLVSLFCVFDFIYPGQKIQTNSNKPIEIFADNGIEWHKNKKKYVALGNTKALQEDLEVTSDKMEAYYKTSSQNQDKIHTLKALGNVVIKNKNAVIKGGNSASYALDKGYFMVVGRNLVLTSKDDNLSADEKIEFWQSENIAIATGNAVAKKNFKYTMKAKKLAWYLDPENNTGEYKIKKIIGFNNVELQSENEIAFSDKALYNNITEICKLFGNVKLRRGNNFLTGDYAEVNLKTGISKLLPNPINRDSQTEKKVKALISKKNNDTK